MTPRRDHDPLRREVEPARRPAEVAVAVRGISLIAYVLICSLVSIALAQCRQRASVERGRPDHERILRALSKIGGGRPSPGIDSPSRDVLGSR